MYKSSLI